MARKIKRANKKGINPWWIVLGVVVILLLWIGGTYNGLVNRTVNVDGAWGDVQTQYQRRADLIPNLVSTVQGFTDQEQTVLLGVTEARSAWAKAVSSGDQTQQIQAAQGLDSAIARLLVSVEAYPDLTSGENFLSLQDELAGTENRIQVSRQRYNDEVRSLNKKVMRFPSNIIANMFGFEQKDFFEATSADAQNAPEVVF